MGINNKKVFLGQEATLSMSDDGGVTYKLWGCCQAMTYSEESEFIEKTPIDSDWISVIPTFSRGAIDVTGLYIISDTDNDVTLTNQLFQWRRNKQLITFRVVFGDGGDVFTGNGYIQAVKGIGNVDEVANVNMQIIITETGYTYQQTQIGCPLVIAVNNTLDSITFEFNADPDATSYVFDLYEVSTLVDSQVINAPFTNPVQVTFNNLDPATAYGLGVTVINLNDLFSKECPRQNDSTEDILCPSVNRSSTTNSISYDFSDSGQGVTQWQMILKLNGTVVDTDTFNAPFVGLQSGSFTGLQQNTAYTLTHKGVFGSYSKECGPYTISTQTLENFTIENNLSDASVSSVLEDGNSFLTILNGSFPVTTGGSVAAQHQGFTGAIQVTMAGTVSGASMTLVKNGGFVECVELNSGPGVYSFASATYLSTDIIYIGINIGSCS
jgi:hypothetical protein